MVSKGVLLPVNEMILGFYRQRVSFNGCSAMGARTKSYDMGVYWDWSVEFVRSVMSNRYLNRHTDSLLKNNRHVMSSLHWMFRLL